MRVKQKQNLECRTGFTTSGVTKGKGAPIDRDGRIWAV